MKRLAITCVALMLLSVFMVLNHSLTDWHSDCYFYADCGFTHYVEHAFDLR